MSQSADAEPERFEPRRSRAIVITFLALPVATKLEVLRAACVAAFVEVGLRTMAFPRLARCVGVSLRTEAAGCRQTATADPEPFTASERRRIDAARRVMHRWPFGDTCLRRALVVGSLLRARHPELLVGVARDATDVHAHAWLDVAGVSIGAAPEEEFRMLRRTSSNVLSD